MSLLLIDKPKGITSHDVVDIVRRITSERRVGHAGTLDPNATGLLIVAVSREDTKKLGFITKETDKEYIAEITLGEERDTDDSEGQVTNKSESNTKIAKEEVLKAIAGFVGEQSQIPPAYSAIKKNGKKSYELARQGKEVELTPRTITVSEASLIAYSYPVVSVKFVVSSGTYIRSLARDIGRTLGTFAYLSNLRRTRIGEYKIEDAVTLEELRRSHK